MFDLHEFVLTTMYTNRFTEGRETTLKYALGWKNKGILDEDDLHLIEMWDYDVPPAVDELPSDDAAEEVVTNG